MRALIKAISVILGVLWIGVTLSGNVEYRGVDNPIINIALGIALIVTPGGVLIMLLSYFLLIAVIVGCGALVAAIGGRMLGTFGVYVGFIAGLALGGWLAVVSRGFDAVGKLVAWVDRKES